MTVKSVSTPGTKVGQLTLTYCSAVRDRLTAQHNILSRLFGDALTSSRIHLGNPSKVLDCGYGGGDWCVQFAEEFEDCEVRMLLMHTALVLDEVNF
jgi:hypothetical protein